MKTNQIIILISWSILLVMSSCVTTKQMTYLQYSSRSNTGNIGDGDIRTSVTPSIYKIMPYDNLYIRVITPDPQWSELFNMEMGTAGMTQESAALSGYTVDDDGNIEIPYVGKVRVGGKTISDIKIELDSIFKNYVTDAAITIRMVNNFVSIIGEVTAPGRYPLTKDRVNIFEALSMAGDMSLYSNRHKVQLIRPSVYGPIIKEFSLTDRSILASEFYYIMPNDIIYAQPMKGRSFQMNSSAISLVLSSISTFLVIYGFFR